MAIDRSQAVRIEPWRRAALDLLAEIHDERLDRAHGLEATREMLELLARVMGDSRRREGGEGARR